MSQPVTVLIVEDEIIIANKIGHHLEEFGYVVAGIQARGEAAVRHCRKEPPDILLLDINLKGDLNGIETARTLEKEGIRIPTIYLTANTDQATFERAKGTRPHAFLGKPYDQTELHRAISLALQSHHAPGPVASGAPEHEVLQSKKVGPPQPPPPDGSQLLSDRIFVRHKNHLVKVFLKDIHYISAERSYCHIHAEEAEYLLSMPLGKLADQLPSSDFLRVHRSYVVNLRQVDMVADDHLVIGKTAIIVGRDQRAELLRRVNMVR
ncbi:LytR/AlgR family response regulator transcription factor [Neolewinella antarctica]|uniref:DNA-binding LytR/AlgR family response regulator n=1 Tax=Neolewinella antarctica TaxID=442734 RepID=A0ABX0XFU2_9BACT|nr:response regulator [Neolewinella antarctica]NJC28072.1 DNA-binding LytR/AlgR family response regulator [Neolewinella antarctica]